MLLPGLLSQTHTKRRFVVYKHHRSAALFLLSIVGSSGGKKTISFNSDVDDSEMIKISPIIDDRNCK